MPRPIASPCARPSRAAVVRSPPADSPHPCRCALGLVLAAVVVAATSAGLVELGLPALRGPLLLAGLAGAPLATRCHRWRPCATAGASHSTRCSGALLLPLFGCAAVAGSVGAGRRLAFVPFTLRRVRQRHGHGLARPRRRRRHRQAHPAGAAAAVDPAPRRTRRPRWRRGGSAPVGPADAMPLRPGRTARRAGCWSSDWCATPGGRRRWPTWRPWSGSRSCCCWPTAPGSSADGAHERPRDRRAGAGLPARDADRRLDAAAELEHRLAGDR